MQDPDYKRTESEQIQEKIKEQKDNKEYLDKIKSIINREFNMELKMRENQLELLQKRILITKKTLHLLRYVLVKSYYNSHELQTEEPLDECNFSAQNRIHPAVKRLLGKNSDKSQLLNTLNMRPKRNTRNDLISKNQVIQESQELSMKVVENNVAPMEKTEKAVNQPTTLPDIVNRGKFKHRLIIGNISKWMPSENEEDSSTHKWMVYVRGPKEMPDVSSIIKKIVFYLHPSYKPNDIVEVTEYPFHLSRRGWGEFPLRLQIHFNCKLNKPVDVIHNLKLDKTYSGRQTLGSETLVDIHLYHEEQSEDITEHIDEEEVLNGEINSEDSNILIKEEVLQFKDELDLSENTMKWNSSHVYLDHNYVKFNGDYPSNSKRKRNHLMSENESQDLKKIAMEEDHADLCNIPDDYFHNVPEILPYILKRIPLIMSELPVLGDNSYHNNFPFMANTSAEYLKWNAMKRVSCEWSRAKFIKHLIMKLDLIDKTNWSVKNILWYARSHGFTPYFNFMSLPQNYKFRTKQLALESDSRQIKREFNKLILNTKDERINVTESEEDQRNAVHVNEIVNYNELVEDENSYNEPRYSFIKQTALDVGVILKCEELLPGVVINGTERALLVAVKCLAENIIRDTYSNNILQNRSNGSNCITKGDIYHSLENSRLNILLK